MHHFSISESLKFGWHALKAHSRLIYQVLLTVLALQVAQSVVQHTLAHSGLGFVATMVIAAAEVVLGVGATLISLKIARHEHAEYSEIVPPARLVLRFVGASLLVGIIVLVPILAAVLVGFAAVTALPGVGIGIAVICGIAAGVASVYLALRYMLVRFTVLDGAGITESLTQSAQATAGHRWALLGFLIVILFVNILGTMLLLVGLLVSIPVTMLALAHVYTKLRAAHHAHHSH